jgi:hypothetical protein
MTALTTLRDHAREMAEACGPDHALWSQIADEIDAYLSPPPPALDLFGNPAQEPQPEATL